MKRNTFHQQFYTIEESQYAQIIYSNMSEIVQHHQSTSLRLCDISLARLKTKYWRLKMGLSLEFLEIISDPEKATDIYTELVNSIQSEDLFLLADSKINSKS